jgi:arginase family enzyme
MTNFIVKIPGINGLGKTEGCEKAGNSILESLKDIYSNENGIIIDVKNLDLEEIHLDNSNLKITNQLIHENSLEIFSQKPKVIFLGGDHSISYSTTKAFLERCRTQRKEPCLIVFDSHADCMPPMKEPTHEEWLSKLVEEGFPVENILLVGARNLDPREILFVKKNNIRIIDINQFLTDMEETCDFIMEFSNGKELYVSIDIDIIDPAFAPGTGYPESGGLTSRQFIYLIQRINKIKNLRAIDIVEINPKKDKDNMTVKLGAKILSELL